MTPPTGPPNPPSLLELSGVGFAYRPGAPPCLSDLALRVTGGERVALVGPNGAGKSTLLKLIVGPEAVEHRPFTGDMRLGDLPPRHSPRLRALAVAYLPQHLPQELALTVEDVVRLGRFPHRGLLGGPSPQEEHLIAEVMEQCDITRLSGRPVSDLSGGERQRVFLAAALAQQPPLLLLDEPTSALDIQFALHLLEILADYTADARRAVVMATHDLNLAARHCTRLVVMHQGRIVADGAPADVLTPALLAEVYRVEAQLIETHPGAPPLVVPVGRLR